jgi:prolipoprotein diacylglyceryltransferase
MVGLATFLGAILILRMAKRDRADVREQAFTLLLTYLACLLGGYVFEWVRMLPIAIAERSFSPILTAGRAAYGGLLGGLVFAPLWLRLRKQPVRPFLDRVTLGMGIEFAFVRAGCYLEGCDYGKPTASAFGVRFPAGSLAATDHVQRGFIPAGAPSLPVHPTELYEGLVAMIAGILAYRRLARGERNGAAFITWLVTYASGRFALELLRDDAARGAVLGLSTAQWVSIGLVLFCVFLARRWGLMQKPKLPTTARTGVALTLIFAVISFSTITHAQDPQPPGGTVLPPAGTPIPPSGTPVAPTPAPAPPAPTPAPDPNAPQPGEPQAPRAPQAPQPRAPDVDTQHDDDLPVQRDTGIGVKALLGPSLPIARTDVPASLFIGLDGRFRLKLSDTRRAELGLEYKHYFQGCCGSRDLIGLPIAYEMEVSKHIEIEMLFALTYNWFSFNSPVFRNTTVTAWGMHGHLGASVAVFKNVAAGFSPLALDAVAADSIGVIVSYEVPFWVTVAF